LSTKAWLKVHVKILKKHQAQTSANKMLAARLASRQTHRHLDGGIAQHNSGLTPSTRIVRYQSQKTTSSRQDGQKHENPGEMPSFSFNDLGATPAVKAVVYIALGIMGTAETVTYGQWAYRRWWKAADVDVADGSVDEQK
jgi:hypothetical protein